MTREIIRRKITAAFNLCLLLAVAILFLLNSCGEKKMTGDADDSLPYGIIVDKTDCKPSPPIQSADSIPPNRDCLEYSYHGENRILRVKHINAVFNCCAIINADLGVLGDTVLIKEKESYGPNGPCHCLCYYDVEYEIRNLPVGKYVIKIIEVYTLGNDLPLAVATDLENEPTGIYCIERNILPETASGYLAKYSGCKEGEYSFDGNRLLSPGNCVTVEYDGKRVLRLKHINAVFNCCPDSILADIRISRDSITITERELNSGCRCLCNYDLDYEIINLKPDDYTVTFITPYLLPLMESLIFTIDLRVDTTGLYCWQGRWGPM
ncbi:MAG: hypothetical protein NT002_06440 [candidate division Zixibacteria bacterium]|nr:hypothetical protein [candidate division Zixibacteria bacterium]